MATLASRAGPVSTPYAQQWSRDLHRRISNLRNGRLHLALAVSLVAGFLIAFTVPIRQTSAGTPAPQVAPFSATGEGLSAALRTQAEAVAGALAEAGAPATSDDSYLAELSGIPGAGLVSEPLLAAVGRLAVRGAMAEPVTQASLVITRQRPVPFTLHEQGLAVSQTSSRMTVGQALGALGVVLGPNDLVWPPPGAALSPGLHVYVRHANRVELTVAGQQQTVHTQAATVGELLAEAGVQLEPLDRVSHSVDQAIQQGMAVAVVIVREVIEHFDEPVPFDTIYTDDPELLQGKQVLVQAGSDGYLRREYRSVQENGQETSRELVSVTYQPPTDQIIARGTKAPVYVMPTPDGDLECGRTMNVYATWYTAASAGGFGRTATGRPVTKGIVAVDPQVIPLGTWLYIPGYGYGLAADTGGAIRGTIIDLGYGPYDVYDWRTHWVEICILH